MSDTPQLPPVPSNGPFPAPGLRRFSFQLSFENPAGKVGTGAGDIVAVDYSAALIKLLSTLSDNPGRLLTLHFRDKTENRIVRVPL